MKSETEIKSTAEDHQNPQIQDQQAPQADGNQ